jgi:predicted SAM-dependent methyltransferase
MADYHDGKFRSYFGAVCVPILDPGDGTISGVTHDWANATAALGGGLAVTVLRLQLRNRRVDIAKQRLAELAIQNRAQWAFFLDDDVLCPPDTLMKMIKLWKSDSKYKVISGVYWSKSEPPMPLIFKGNLEGSYWDWKTTDLIPVDGAGAGCLFIDLEMLKKIPKPWFSCNYNFEDPRSEYDLKSWELGDAIRTEMMKGESADKNLLAELEKQLVGLGKVMNDAQNNTFDPNLWNNKHADAATTEDLYFFKKVKEYTGNELWMDCSIQCWHQDKKSGRLFGISPDMPQSKPRYEGSMTPGNKVVLDIGSGNANYHIHEGKPIRIDIDPKVNPDIICDARQIPLNDCFADVVISSHLLEHFSFHETLAVLREWVRLLKIGGELTLVLPNLKWAAQRLLDKKTTKDDMERVMFMYYSAQVGDQKDANLDVHKAGFTAESVKGLLAQLPELSDVKVVTSDGNYGSWKEYVMPNDLGYNIIATAKKIKHQTAISLKMPIKLQEEAMKHIGIPAEAEKEEEKKAPVKKHARKVQNHV